MNAAIPRAFLGIPLAASVLAAPVVACSGLSRSCALVALVLCGHEFIIQQEGVI